MVAAIVFSPPSLGTQTSEIPINSILIGSLAPHSASASGRAKNPVTASALTNHWLIHFIQDEKRSIRLQSSPSGPYAAPITLNFTQVDNGIPPNLVKTVDLPVETGLTLEKIMETILGGMFVPYFLDASGHGCRYWIWHFLGFLTENGMITSPDKLNYARMCLQQVWVEGKQLAEEDQQTHLVPGTFPETN